MNKLEGEFCFQHFKAKQGFGAGLQPVAQYRRIILTGMAAFIDRYNIVEQ